MSTQQDIYDVGSENRPPMLNKDNYVPWSSRLLRYTKSKPNGKLIYNSIKHGLYVRRMIPEPCDTDREVPIAETFHEQTDEELTEKEVKQMESDDQAIQIILMGLPEDIYAAVDSYETAQEIWLRVQQMMKGFDIRIQDKKAKLVNEWERFTSTDEESIESYYHLDYTQLYDFLKYNQAEVNELRVERLARAHDPLALMENSNNPYNSSVFHQDQPSLVTYMQQPQPNNNFNPQPSFNMNYMQQPLPNPEDITDPTTAINMELVLMANTFKLNYSTPTNNNQRISSNPYNRKIAQPGMNLGQDRQMQMVRAARAEGNAIGNNGDLEEIEEVNANCILMANSQQASTPGTQTDKPPVYDSNRSAEVHHSENCYNNDIFNMFTQEEQFTELLEPIPEPHQVQQNDSNVISPVSNVEQSEGTVEQHPATIEETHALYDSLYINLANKVEAVNSVNRNLKETNAELTTELAIYKNQESVLKSIKKNMTNLKALKKSTISSLEEEKKQLKSDFKIREDKFLDKQIQLENKIKELDNILVKIEKHDPPDVYDSEETLQLSQESRLKMKQLNKERKPANYEAAKFVRGFKSLAKEADESLTKHKALEFEIERLLRAVVNQDNMSIVQKYAILWNNWYTKCEECKYDKISYDKAYNDMQQKFEWLQAQLGDLKGKSKDTPCESDTLDPLSQKLENENVELEFLVLNYAKENAHLKTTYKNLFDSINVTWAQTKTITDSLQQKLHDTIYENVKLKAQLFDKVSEQKDITKCMSVNTKFANQSTERKPSLQSLRNNFVVRQPNAFQSERPKFSKTRVPPKIVETNDLSNPVTSNSVPTTTESKVVTNDKVIAPGIFRINYFKTFREDKFMPINIVRASVRTNPITVSQPHVITKKHVNSDSNGLFSTGVDNTAKIRRP
ncbi:hypothetical protein Tco_0585927 [Tanacetum coccineum]